MRSYKAELLAIILALLSLAMSAFVGYTYDNKDLTGRIVKVETRQDAQDRSIDRIERKVDQLNEKVDRLIEAMLKGRGR